MAKCRAPVATAKAGGQCALAAGMRITAVCACGQWRVAAGGGQVGRVAAGGTGAVRRASRKKESCSRVHGAPHRAQGGKAGDKAARARDRGCHEGSARGGRRRESGGSARGRGGAPLHWRGEGAPLHCHWRGRLCKFALPSASRGGAGRGGAGHRVGGAGAHAGGLLAVEARAGLGVLRPLQRAHVHLHTRRTAQRHVTAGRLARGMGPRCWCGRGYGCWCWLAEAAALRARRQVALALVGRRWSGLRAAQLRTARVRATWVRRVP